LAAIYCVSLGIVSLAKAGVSILFCQRAT